MIKNKIKIKTGVGVLLVVLCLGLTAMSAFAADGSTRQLNAQDTPLSPTRTSPATAPEIATGSPTSDTLGRPWQSDQWLTAGLQFLIRGKEALGWSLNIQESGIQNSAIRATYQKVLTIVNGLFILGLLAIAGLWLFNSFIPRATLRRVMLVYALAVVFINFALPLNQLIIDGSNLIQKSFLTDGANRIAITDVVRTPDYVEATAFTQASATTLTHTTKTINLQFQKAAWEDAATLGVAMPERREGQVPYQLRTNGDQPLVAQITTEDPPVESIFFHFAMLALTGLAYFMLAVIFMLRAVLLWALLILSPLLFFLAIFNATRGYFYQWLSWYGRWLFIGPLAALGIALVVNIWKLAGLPLTSAYTSTTSFGMLSNLAFYLPGQTVPNTLSTPAQMMEYLVFLAMLYLPLLFAFALTRQKHFAWALNTMQEKVSLNNRLRERETIRSEEKNVNTPEGENIYSRLQGESSPLQGVNFVDKFKGFFERQIGAVMPVQSTKKDVNDVDAEGEDIYPRLQHRDIETASSLLPQQLALTDTRNLIGLLSQHGDSRHAREEGISKMAFPEQVTDSRDRRVVTAVTEEITKRAASGDAEALLIQNEIVSARTETKTESKTEVTMTSVAQAPEKMPNAPEIQTPLPPLSGGQFKSPPEKGEEGGLKPKKNEK
ncbi:type IV secretion system protein [Candidatus Peregrinibacteria bacterium]|nr:type IV secretion system protein [Candidatus Peregrinibacteria bacterium]